MSKSNPKQAESPEGPTQAANCELASQSIEVVKIYKNGNTLLKIIPWEQYNPAKDDIYFNLALEVYDFDYRMTIEHITLKEYQTYKTLFGGHPW